MILNKLEPVKEDSSDLIVIKSMEEIKKNNLDRHNENKNLDADIIERIKYFTTKVKIDHENNILIIKGIDYKLFFKRIYDYYNARKFNNIFARHYTYWSEIQFNKKKIPRNKMKIKELYFPLFFSLEIAYLFKELGDFYGIGYYKKVSKLIIEETWVKKLFEPVKFVPVDTTNLKNIKYTLKDYQLDFVQAYNTLKDRFSLEGYILSFDQGLGKTLTSIALAECLNKDCILIVCPNSLKENWAYEIKEYFDKYKNTKLWKEEVFVVGTSGYKFTKNTKYIIVNLEGIPKLYPYVNPNKNNMIIVDEMHNFRNKDSKRTKELVDLKIKANCKDNLLMSGTPIKAVPNEIVPALMMIDPLFDEECARLFQNAFSVDDIRTKTIVNARFGITMHRKTKEEVLDLPEKHIYPLELSIRNADIYEIKSVKQEVNELFNKLYDEEIKKTEELRKDYIDAILTYSSAFPTDTKRYIKYVKNDVNTKKAQSYHELDEIFFKKFPSEYIIPNIKDVSERKKFELLNSRFISMQNHCMGKALGKILPKRRSEMYIALYEENKNKIINMIENNTKKTVIFSSLLPVINYISDDLSKHGFKNVKIVGGVPNRMEIIQLFKNSDDVNILLATSQSLSTGVTLTEANQMFFFGTPWRSADYNQACDRIYRIGQNTEVNIYNVLLTTPHKNLSTRMDDILQWSDDMFTNMVEPVIDLKVLESIWKIEEKIGIFDVIYENVYK